jgi:hypothetical protein
LKVLLRYLEMLSAPVLLAHSGIHHALRIQSINKAVE